MKRVLLLAATCVGALTILGAQPANAGPEENTSLTGLTNAILNQMPAPSGWHGRHICVGVDQTNWGECITFPFPT
jgi:hypothetical protein